MPLNFIYVYSTIASTFTIKSIKYFYCRYTVCRKIMVSELTIELTRSNKKYKGSVHG